MSIGLQDFCGFTFNGVHSSELGFIRVSSNNRYSENLLPAFQDKTVPVPGGDGTYFFNSFYTNRTFAINIAFDSITEVQMRRMRQVFNGKDMGALIFDEAPYKAYTAKVQGVPQLQYVCFDIGGARIYKGEGTINFVCYYPYAKSVHKFLNEYRDEDYPNKSEWAAASGMLATQGNYDAEGAIIELYNPGDIETDSKIYVPTHDVWAALSGYLSIILYDAISDELGSLVFSSELRNAIQIRDHYICINSYSNLVEEVDNAFVPTGKLLNKYIQSGDFFKIPVGDDYSVETLTHDTNVNPPSSLIEYNYLYY